MRQGILHLFERTLEWELNFLEKLQTIRHPILDWIMIFFTKLGDVGMIWIITSIVLLFFKKYRMVGVTSLLALIIGAILTDLILKGWIGRERPFTHLDSERIKEILIIKKPSSLSFPSGHTTSSFASGIVLAYYFRKYRIPFILLASLIAFSRMYLYVHFPTDILAGLIVGTLAAGLSLLIGKRWLRPLIDRLETRQSTS